jgi:hypothetical protein
MLRVGTDISYIAPSQPQSHLHFHKSLDGEVPRRVVQYMDPGNLRLLRDYLLDNISSSDIAVHVQSLMKSLEEPEPTEVDPKGEDSWMKISVLRRVWSWTLVGGPEISVWPGAIFGYIGNTSCCWDRD